jgi:predicted dehydrogenase
MRTLNCAVIGPGYIGKEHARVYSEHPLTELTTIVDIDESRAREVGERFGASHVATDIDDGLSIESIDLVSIATPKEHHLEPTRTALEHGCHVLLEKPIAGSESDAREIGALAEAAEGELAVGYLLRFDPRYAQLKDEIEEFGDVLGMHAARITNAPVYRRASTMTHPVYYLAVHDIDMLRWYAESEVAEVYATASNGIDGGEGPALIHSNFTFESGVVATLETNWARPDTHPSHRTEILRVTGSNGFGEIHMDPAGDIPITTDSEFRFGSMSELHGTSYGPLRNHVDHLVECVRTGSEPLVTWEDGLQSLRVANTIRESIDTGAPVSFDT